MNKLDIRKLITEQDIKNNTFYATFFGDVKIDRITDKGIYIDKDIRFDFDGVCEKYGVKIYLYPSREYYENPQTNHEISWRIYADAKDMIRWRGVIGDVFFYIDVTGVVVKEIESGSIFNDHLYNSYNYFRSETVANQVAKEMNKILIEYHKLIRKNTKYL